MPDPDIEIRRRGWGSSGGGGSSRPLEKRGGADSKKKFSALGLKTSGGGVGALAPQLDRLLVYSLEHVLLTGEALE